MTQLRVSFSIALSVTLVVIVILLVYWSIMLSKWYKFNRASEVAIGNNMYCVKDEGLCRLVKDDNLEVPGPGTSVFSYTVARYAADLIARVELLFRENYKSFLLVMPPGMANIKTLYYHDKIIGFVGLDPNGTYWVVFRGTSTSKEWRKDFQFMQDDIILKKGMETQRVFQELSCHQGFLDVYEDLQEDIRSALAHVEGARVVATGHSLGSSLATLTCLDLQSKYQVSGYVFGGPRVCQEVPTDTMIAFFRINNTCDPIKDMPMSVMWNIENAEEPFYYEHGGQEITFTDNRLSLTNNHLMPVYIQAIENEILRGTSDIVN